jgi:CheY-like chemotaxis protein
VWKASAPGEGRKNALRVTALPSSEVYGQPVHRGKTPLVLLVEDDHDIRESLTELIESQGVRVKAARDGAEGLDLLRAGLQPRAVFLDNRMPRMDGAGVLAAMREDPALASIPVVWMSGDRRQPPSVAAHLGKPFDMDELVAVLGSLCEAD